MKKLFCSRRLFLKQATLIAGGIATLPARVRAAASGTTDDVRVAIIGLGGKGGQHAGNFPGLPGVRVAALCEVDPKRLSAHAEKLKQNGMAPFTANDPRRVIERDDVDAVVIATPNHWHALLAVWAMRAGKDVYVEKPVSHNIHEGARMVAEAKAKGRIVQAGTQYRSCAGLRAAASWLKEGHVGKPLWAHVPWYEHRPPIGKCEPFTPKDLDYDLWCGPAPLEPLNRPKLHYDWHWVWSTGDGDLGNSGIHAFDACRMFLPGAVFPRRVLSLGGRFTYDDAAQTPNTQLTLVEYPDLPIILDNRNLSMRRDTVTMDHVRGIREGFVLQYEGGYFAGLRAGGVVFDKSGKELKRFPGDGGAGHAANFVKAIRSRRVEDLHAPVVEGHVSSAVCHLGNLSYRLGTPCDRKACEDALGNHASVQEGFDRVAKSLEGIGVDLEKTPFTLGPSLAIDPASGDIHKTGDGDAAQLDKARALARGSHRAPYTMPI
ncbi:MAG: Gfo/Idh/MocA family oxidoreductase [Planctomycetota bacterium]|nr:Gfo/Idh/MocA family oxidoreductase [Planctomycetota bacterium]